MTRLKKTICSCVALLLILIQCPFVAAMATACTEEVSQYQEYTIDFRENGKYTSDFVGNHQNTIDEAENYVRSLNLPDKGVGYIEDACLAQLEDFREESAILESYTVLVPEKRSSPTYYGTMGGLTFYSDDYSKYDKTIRKEVNNLTQLQQFFNAASNAYLTFGANKYVVTANYFLQLMGVSSYTVFDGDFSEYYIRVYGTSRGIYTKSASDYTMHTSTERGTYEPYIVMHTGGNSMQHITEKAFGSFSATTPSYYDTSTQLAWAYAQYQDGSGVMRHSLMSTAVLFGFESK